MWNKLKMNWTSYRYRFVPWMALNLKNKSPRSVTKLNDKLVPDEMVIENLLSLLSVLSKRTSVIQTQPQTKMEALNVMEDVFGFAIDRGRSCIESAGIGVFVVKGEAKKGSLVALYPGTIYQVTEPLLLPSIANSFIFRCIDGLHVDGKDRGLSKSVYKSCVYRDAYGFHPAADLSWLTLNPCNPLSIGQYVNNQSPDLPCNVAYQECDLPLRLVPVAQRRFLPNIYFSGNNGIDNLRIVALIATRDIPKDTELFSTYYTVVSE